MKFIGWENEKAERWGNSKIKLWSLKLALSNLKNLDFKDFLAVFLYSFLQEINRQFKKSYLDPDEAILLVLNAISIVILCISVKI